MEIIERREEVIEMNIQASQQESLPGALTSTLSEVNLQLYQEFLWYQIGQNIPTVHINRHSAYSDKRNGQKETPPSYYFQQVFTLENTVVVCKVIDRRVLISRRNIYHKNRIRGSRSSSSFERYNSLQSDYVNHENDVYLQFPTKIVRNIICAEFEKGEPLLFIPSAVGIIYILKLKELTQIAQTEEFHLPILELEIGYSYMTQLVKASERGPFVDREGMTLIANCNNAVLHAFTVPQLFDEPYRRISSSYEIKLGKSLFDNLLSSIMVKHNEKEVLVSLEYISHKILVGVTRNNVLKVINLNRRAVAFEYKINSDDSQQDDSSGVCLKVLNTNPLIRNDKINFLLAFAKLNSAMNRSVKLFNLSFILNHRKQGIVQLNQIPTIEDIGVNCEVSSIATYNTPNQITGVDLNTFGLAVSSFDEAECNSEIHHIRFAEGKAEVSACLFSDCNKISSFDDKRSKLIAAEVFAEDVHDLILNNHDILPTETILQAMRAINIPVDQGVNSLKPLEKRSVLLKTLQSNWENGNLSDISMRRFFQDCFLKSKDMTKVEGVFLSQDQDFPPIILRNYLTSLAVQCDAIESLNLMTKINLKREMGIEVFNLIDLDNPQYFENFLLILSFFKKFTGSYTSVLQNYIERDYDNIPLLIEDILTEVEPHFKSENRIRFFQLIEDLEVVGASIGIWCQQLTQLLYKTLGTDQPSNLANTHLVDGIEVWGFSTFEVISGVAKQRVKHSLELCLDFALMVEFINKTPSTSNIQRLEGLDLRPFHDHIKSMISFLVLMNYTPNLSNIYNPEYKEIVEVINNLNHVDTFTYFVIFEYRKYLGNAANYHLVEPQEWINNVSANLISKISFDPRFDKVDQIPEIVSFLLKLREYETALVVIDQMFYKNPALEYARTECLYHLGRIGEMIASLFYVASYVNLESFQSRDKPSIYNNFWHKTGKDYLKSVTERITSSLSSGLVNFLITATKFSFCQSQNIIAGIASTALYLKEIDNNSLIIFLKEIIDLHKNNQEYQAMYNFLHLFPKKHGDYQREYVQVFQNIISDLVSENQLKNVLDFQLNADDYIIISLFLQEYFKQESEKMIADFGSALPKPEDILSKFEKSYALYHKVIFFFLEKELYKQAGTIMVSFYENLVLADNEFKMLNKTDYQRILKARLSLLNEAIYCLDVAEDQNGYLVENAEYKYKVRRNTNSLVGSALKKADASTWLFGRKKDIDVRGNLNLYVEDFSEYDFSEDEFIVLNKERLIKHKDLLSARIILEEKGALSLKESDYLLPENIVRIGKYLVAVSEVDKAIDLCITFRFAIEEVVTFLVFMYFNNPESSVAEQKFYDCLRRVVVKAESYKGVFSREIVAEAVLQISKAKYQEPITLPPFLIDDFKNKDPVKLVRIYLDFKKHEEAIRTLVYTIQKNRKLINEREIQGDGANTKNGGSYIDPNLFQEALAYLDNLGNNKKDLILRAIEG